MPQAAVKALLGVRGLLGDSARKYIDSLRLSQYKRAQPTPSKPAAQEEETHKFGVVPCDIVKALHVDDWKATDITLSQALTFTAFAG